MRAVPWPDGVPPFDPAASGAGFVCDDDQLCDRIREDSRRQSSVGRAVALNRYLDAIPGLADKSAVLDTAIVAAIQTAVCQGNSRDEAIERLLRDHPELRGPILAADFLDQTLGQGFEESDAGGNAARPELPLELGPRTHSGRARYELRTRLAEGASGVVYRAVDRAVSTADGVSYVAVKCLRGMGFRFPHLFKIEAQRARRVAHPSVARVLDAGEDARAGEYLVFEYCEGRTLEQWASRRPSRLNEDESVEMALGIAGGVAAVHRAGFCHGDLHPGNVMVSSDGTPRLIDFGAARSELASTCFDAQPLGAPGFAAPELFRGESGVSGQDADTYSVAGLLFWMLTGEAPNGSTVEEAEAIIGGERAVKTVLLKGRSRDLCAVLERALDHDAGRRYSSVDDLAEDLRRLRRSEPLAWSVGSWGHRLGLAVRRAPAASALTAGLAIAVLVGVASMFLAFYVSNRSALSEARTQLSAKESQLSATAAQARAAEAINQEMEVAKGLWSFMRSMLASIKSDSDAMRYLPMLMVVERIAGEAPTFDAMLQAESRRKRCEIAEVSIRPAIERGRIERVQDLLVAMVLSGIRIEDGDAGGARPVLALARAAARKMLIADDPLAIRVDVYWAVATTIHSATSKASVPSEEATDAGLILELRKGVVDSLAPRMRERLVGAMTAGPPQSR